MILIAEARVGELSRFFPGRSNDRNSNCRSKSWQKCMKNIGSAKMNSKNCFKNSSYLRHSGPMGGSEFHFWGSKGNFLRSRTSFLRKQGRFLTMSEILFEEAGAIWDSNFEVSGAKIWESLPRQTRFSVVLKCNFKEAGTNLNSFRIHFWGR